MYRHRSLLAGRKLPWHLYVGYWRAMMNKGLDVIVRHEQRPARAGGEVTDTRSSVAVKVGEDASPGTSGAFAAVQEGRHDWMGKPEAQMGARVMAHPSGGRIRQQGQATEQQEHAGIERAAECHRGREPLRGCPIEQIEAEAHQGSSGGGYQREPGNDTLRARHPGCESRGYAHHKPGRAKRDQSTGEQAETGECLTPFDEVAEDSTVRQDGGTQEGRKGSWDSATQCAGEQLAE
jgi:hypothetical protein